jgi:hypothetical protein
MLASSPVTTIVIPSSESGEPSKRSKIGASGFIGLTGCFLGVAFFLGVDFLAGVEVLAGVVDFFFGEVVDVLAFFFKGDWGGVFPVKLTDSAEEEVLTSSRVYMGLKSESESES